MSYILDALKKADAERERGTIPGLLSQPHSPAPEDETDNDPRAPKPYVWAAAGVGVCLVAVLGWHLATREPAPAASAAEQAPPPMEQSAPTAMQPPQPESPPPATTMANPGTAPAAHMSPPPPRPAPRAAETSPARQPDLSVTARPAPTRQQPPAAEVNPKQAAAPSQRVPSLQELPEDVRRDIPPLTIGGAMYSDTPSARMLVINSQVFHEGDKPYQGLVLEEIRLKSAVFSYRGYRYSINY